jgi:hypothetical protein
MNLLTRYLFLAATTVSAMPAIVMSRPGFAGDWRAQLKSRLGPRRTARLRCLVRGKKLPRWGNLRVAEPFSSNWGIDRGTPVDRYYGDRFFAAHSRSITGKVLEIQNSTYTDRYGYEVQQADSVDIDGTFGPTIVCDLAKADNVIASDSYDCFLLPYTLLVVRDLEGALRNALRIVRPGGTILATTSVMTPILAEYPEYWRMTEAGWREVLDRVWPGCEYEVRTHGNCLSAVASVLGLAQQELTDDELRRDDPRFPVLISIFCRKPAAARQPAASRPC